MTIATDKALKWSIILLSAVIGLIVDYVSPGWGRPALLTLLIFGSMLAFCREYYGLNFWVVFLAALTIHSSLVLHFRSIINDVPVSILFLFAVGEIFIIAMTLGFAFPEKKKRKRISQDNGSSKHFS